MPSLSSLVASLACLGLGQTSLAHVAKRAPAHSLPAQPGVGPDLIADINILLAFKKTVTQDPKGCLKTWDLSIPIAEWGRVNAAKPPGLKDFRVSVISLDECYLAGPNMRLDGFLDKLPYLARFRARTNNFTGKIPDNIGPDNLKFIFVLDLRNNKLDSTEFPPGIVKTDMVRLDLCGNNLKGTIPAEIFAASNPKAQEIYILYLSDNQFSGQIPATFGESKASYISLAGNQLTGLLPDNFGHMPNALSVDVADNKLSGHLPASTGSFPALNELDLSGNEFSGPLPATIGNLVHMSYFNVSNNKLTGPIPDKFGGLRNASIIDLSNNNLAGAIPDSLCRNPQLQFLSLSGNCLDVSKLPPACKNLQAKAKAKPDYFLFDFTPRKDCAKA